VQLGATMGRDDAASRAHWNGAATRLASILFPAACGAWLLGPTVLPLLFTQRYAGAIPLFLLATFEIPIWILPADALLRAAGDTRFLFVFNAARVLVTVALVVAGVRVAGLGGAIVGGIVSESIARAVMIARGRRFLGRPSLAQVLDWPTLGRVALAAALAGLPAWSLRLVLTPGIHLVLASMALYGAAYVPLRALLLTKRAGRFQIAPAA
jgi:O-antigen/teichoic acid export membrane protein